MIPNFYKVYKACYKTSKILSNINCSQRHFIQRIHKHKWELVRQKEIIRSKKILIFIRLLRISLGK